MPRKATNSLTPTHIRNAKPQAKPRKLFDGQGMFVLVHPNGSKYFRLRYTWDGKEKVLALGVYPETSLAEARAMAGEARKSETVWTPPLAFGDI